MDGIDYLMAGTEREYPVLYQGEKADLYAWYYNTQACLMVGGAPWKKWNRLFQTEVTKAQAPDGRWPPMKLTVDCPKQKRQCSAYRKLCEARDNAFSSIRRHSSSQVESTGSIPVAPQTVAPQTFTHFISGALV